MDNMYTIKKVLIIILIIIIIGAVVLSIVSREEAPVVIPNNTNNEQIEDVTPPVIVTDEKTFIENYIKNNIVTIATNATVLGGTWYVVSVLLDTEANTGEVVYEDGHIQSTATFSYTYQENPESVTITNFIVKTQ